MRRIRRFSADWGYTAFVMTNLFAFRATDPRVMKENGYPVGHHNNGALLQTAEKCTAIVAAWGTHGAFRDRAAEVRTFLSKSGYSLSCLDLTKDGHPKHPLYVAAAAKLQPFPLTP